MTFIQTLLESGYVFDNEDYDGCYVKQDEDGNIHCYQEGEDEGEWNYVKMTDEFDVITEKTFIPDQINVKIAQTLEQLQNLNPDLYALHYSQLYSNQGNANLQVWTVTTLHQIEQDLIENTK